MSERRVLRSVARASYVLAASIALVATARPVVAGQTGAYAEVQDCDGTTQESGGYGSTSVEVSSNACGSVQGSAQLSPGEDLEFMATSPGPGYGVGGSGWLQDYLGFNGIPVGGSVEVTVTITGGWGGSFDWGQNAGFQVRYDLLLGDLSSSNAFSSGIASANLAALVPSQGFTGDCGGADSNCPGPGASPPYFGEVGGFYSFSRTWEVYYFGGPSPQLPLFVALQANASNGAWGRIDHERLTVTVHSPTVTFTSTSGNPYTVPEPSSGDVLAGSILVALARWRSRARRTAALPSERRGARGPDDE